MLYTRTPVYTHMCVYVDSVCIHVYVCVCVCIYIHRSVNVYVYTCTHTRTHTYARPLSHTHTLSVSLSFLRENGAEIGEGGGERESGDTGKGLEEREGEGEMNKLINSVCTHADVWCT